ncbi:MAG: enoyl-CoA hydratase/isomerase family protein, partial [Desulfatirhabdiaceae bacterium]|nr:enoyl-CoA hydratase/isomerase family protein [Desulfatirhabdiaceae bacterium]
MPFELDHEMFSSTQIEEVAVIRFKGNLLFQFSDLYLKEALFDHLHKVSHSRDIKVILFFGSQDKIRRQDKIQFFHDLSQPGVDVKRVTRIYNSVNQLILMIQKMQKLVIHADNGEVGSLFMNVSLACDYRIIGDKTVFQYPTIELGLVPKGGGVFFLSRILGESKTIELLLSGDDVDAAQALALGLVNQVVPSATLEKSAVETAQRFSKKPLRLITGVKKLQHLISKDLPVFLELENQILLEAIASERFRKRLNKHLPV